MKYQVEVQKGSAKFSFTVPKAEWESEIDAAYHKTKGKYTVHGFRKGHAPRKIIENLYGASVFFDEAFNACAGKAYTQALREHEEVFPVDDPKVDVSDFGEKELAFTMTVTTKPEVTLSDYKGLTVEKAEHPVTAKDVDDEIERARQAKSRKVEITDRAVKDGDEIKLDYSGSVDGVKFQGGTATDQTLVIGSNTFIPGFEPQLIGMSVGESRDLSVKFPDDYHAEELKGKDAVFAVTVKGITEKQVPQLNDEFVKDTTAFETVKDYRADVEKRLKESAAQREDNENKNRMIEAVVAKADVDIPSCMIDSELDYMLQDFEYQLRYMYGGMKLDDYFKYTGSSREDFKKTRTEEAKRSVKTRLVMEKIIKDEDVQATDADVDAKLTEIAGQAGKTLDEYKPTVSAHQLEHIKSDIIVTKVLDLLAATTKFEAPAKKAKSTAKPKKESKEQE